MKWYWIVVGAPVDGMLVDFLKDDEGNRISPLFNHLQGLYLWMRANGYDSAMYDGDKFFPWRARKITPLIS